MTVRAIKIASFVLAAGLLWTPASGQSSDPLAAAAPASATVLPRQKPKAAGGYYVEFRAGQIGLYGHSYAAYGRLDRHDNPVTTSYADLHPMGGYAVMALGHFVPVPANTEWNPEVLTLPVTAKYRVKLNETQYNNLTAAVQRASANKRPYWNALTQQLQPLYWGDGTSRRVAGADAVSLVLRVHSGHAGDE